MIHWTLNGFFNHCSCSKKEVLEFEHLIKSPHDMSVDDRWGTPKGLKPDLNLEHELKVLVQEPVPTVLVFQDVRAPCCLCLAVRAFGGVQQPNEIPKMAQGPFKSRLPTPKTQAYKSFHRAGAKLLA
jgi:hypothetical protein